MFVSLIFSIIILLPYSLQGVYDSMEDDNISRQRFPKVRIQNHLDSPERQKHHKHHTKKVIYSSEEKSEECLCTCENCTEKSCCDKDICNQCILQQSSVLVIPYNYPLYPNMMPQYNMNVAIPVAPNVSVTTKVPTTMVVTQPVNLSPTTSPLKAEELVTYGLFSKKADSMTENELIRNYILSKIQEEKQIQQIIAAQRMKKEIQKTPQRRVDKSIFKASGRISDDDDERRYPFEDVKRLLEYISSVRSDKIRPDMKDIQG